MLKNAFSNAEKTVFVCIYVDDLLVASLSEKSNKQLLSRLAMHFDLKLIGEPKLFLGLTVTRDRGAKTLQLGLQGYVRELLKFAGMEQSNSVSTPITPNVHLKPVGEEQVIDRSRYQQIVGSLMYMSTTVRPDISNAVGTLAMVASAPGPPHWQELKHLMQYLSGSDDLRLTLGGPELTLKGYADANHGDLYNGRSTEGYITYLGAHPVSWHSKKQASVALSTTEAEYMALSQVSKEIIWLKCFLTDLDCPQQIPTVFCDNRGGVSLTQHHEFHPITKHIKIHFHFTRKSAREGAERRLDLWDRQPSRPLSQEPTTP